MQTVKPYIWKNHFLTNIFNYCHDVAAHRNVVDLVRCYSELSNTNVLPYYADVFFFYYLDQVFGERLFIKNVITFLNNKSNTGNTYSKLIVFNCFFLIYPLILLQE